MPPPITAMRSALVFIGLAYQDPSPPRKRGPGATAEGLGPWIPAFAVAQVGMTTATRSVTLCVSPEPLGGDRRAFDHRPEFLERDVGVELAVAGKSAKAAIAAGD